MLGESKREKKRGGEIRIEKREGRDFTLYEVCSEVGGQQQGCEEGEVGGWLLAVVHNFYYV